MKPLSRKFFNRDTILVAHELLGKYLIHRFEGIEHIGKIVEVEAYLGPHDLAAHSAKGLTPRTKVMFGPPGHAYVYLIYGMYYCMNVVTEEEGHASAVLLRALEPIQGITHKTSGPGLLCKAMHINKALHGQDLTKAGSFFITQFLPEEPIKIIKRKRIGVDYARHWAKRLLRFYIKGNPFVSKL